MTSATKGGLTYTFTYNDEGLRTSKTVDGVTTYYYYEGTLLVAEQSDLETIVYLYDSTGAPIGFRYRTPSYAENVWDDYYYEKNMQGDIVRVYNSEGVKLVSYVYTAWGERASTTYHHGGANTTVTNNPFTYRGYYYDNDLELYCTSTRYYDSNIGRWISPDSVMSGVGGNISGYNLYAYCFNNPVMYSDHTGCWPSWVEKVAIAVAIVAVAVTAVAVVSAATAGTGGIALTAASVSFGTACGGLVGGIANEESFVNGWIGGAVNGLTQSVGTSILGPAGTIIGGGLGSGLGTAVTEMLNNKGRENKKDSTSILNESLKSAAIGTVMSTVTAGIGYGVDFAKGPYGYNSWAESLRDGVGIAYITPGFAEMMKGFFSSIDDALVYIFCD